MESSGHALLPKEVAFQSLKQRELRNLIFGILYTSLPFFAWVYTDKYWYLVFILMGLSSLWNYFFPGTEKLIIQAGYVWRWTLKDQLKPEDKIKKVETIDKITFIYTPKKHYRIEHSDLSKEELAELELLKKWVEESSTEPGEIKKAT
jgi:hypothetical protein